MQIEIEVESDRPLSLSPSPFIYSLTAAVSDILSLTAPLCKHRSLRSVLSGDRAKQSEREGRASRCNFGHILIYILQRLRACLTVASKNIAVMLDVAVSVLVSKLAPPWEFPLQISEHSRIYPILYTRSMLPT